MKKAISILLCVVVLMCCSVTAFAAESYLEGNGATAQSTVTYQVNSNYCITIPETIDALNGFELTAPYMNIANDEQVNVYICGDNLIEMTNEFDDSFDLMLNADNDGIIARFFKDQTTSGLISGYPKEAKMYPAGTYTGTVIFTISLEKIAG